MALDVIIADAHRLTLNGICVALEGQTDMAVVGAVTSAADLLAALKRTSPDVVLVDADLPDMDALTCIGLVLQNHPGVRVGVLFADKDLERITAALGAGVAACVMKNVAPEDLPCAVRQIVEATVFTAAPGPPRAAVEEPVGAMSELTARERTMLAAIARGLSNKAISKELWVTEQTVKFHLNNVYRKLGVPNRTAAARFAYECGLAGVAA